MAYSTAKSELKRWMRTSCFKILRATPSERASTRTGKQEQGQRGRKKGASKDDGTVRKEGKKRPIEGDKKSISYSVQLGSNSFLLGKMGGVRVLLPQVGACVCVRVCVVRLRCLSGKTETAVLV